MSSFLGGGGGGGQTKATGNITVWVATTGSDSNPGTFAQPFATIQHAVNYVIGFDYQNLYFPTINVEDGTYILPATVQLSDITNVINPFGSGGFITGNTTTPGNVVVSGQTAGVSCFQSSGLTAVWSLDGFQFDTPGVAVFATEASIINLLGNAVNFADTSGGGQMSPMAATNYSAVFLIGPTATLIATSILNWMVANRWSQIWTIFSTVVFPVATSVVQAFVTAQQYCFAPLRNNSYTNFGGVTGARLLLQEYSFVQTFNYSTFVPGTTDGVSSSIAPFDFSSAIGFNNTFTTNPQSGANYQLILTDYGNIIEMTNAGANTVTVPTNATVGFPVGGTRIKIVQAGTGATTVVAAGGVTGHNFGTLAAQWNSAEIYQRAVNEWVMTLG